VTALCPVTPGCCIVSPCATTWAGRVEGVSDPRQTLDKQNPQSARRNNFQGEQISRWFLLLAENLSASNYPGAADSTLCLLRDTLALLPCGAVMP
jgi:hypothetical protein